MSVRVNRLSVRIVAPVAIMFLVSAGALAAYVWTSANRQTIAASVVSARATVSQFKALRAYYTEQVVNKVKASGVMKVAAAHDAPDTIPLPATMIHELSETLGTDASAPQIRLYSSYPFPNRAARWK